MRKTALALTVSALTLCTTQVFSQEDGTVYREGYDLILDQRWSEAQIHFQRFAQDFPDSSWADDAAFWRCYAREQQGGTQEEQFACYEQFSGDWPNSSWVADARSKLLVLGSGLASRGNPEFLRSLEFIDEEEEEWDFDFDFDFDTDINESVARALDQAERELARVRVITRDIDMPELPNLPDEFFINNPDPSVNVNRDEMRRVGEEARRQIERVRREIGRRNLSRRTADDELLMVLAALRENERASDILIQRFEASDDAALRARIVLLLEDIGGENVTRKLIDAATNDSSARVRENAVIVLLDRDDFIARDSLAQFVEDENFPIAVRAEILSGMDNWEDERALPILERILTGSSEPSLVEEAADALTDNGSERAINILLQAFENQSTPELRYLMLEEIAEIETPAVLNLLSDLAMESDDDRLATIAIEGIADREDNLGVAALEHIYTNTDNRQRRLAALEGIGDAESEQAVEVLTRIIEGETEPQLLAAAAHALGDSERESAIAVLLNLYRNTDNPDVQRGAIRSLRRLDHFPAATEAMLEILEDRLDAAAQ